jgi:hypothetical protein
MGTVHAEAVAEKVSPQCERCLPFIIRWTQAGYCSVLIARLFPSLAFVSVDPAALSDALRSPFITVQKVASPPRPLPCSRCPSQLLLSSSARLLALFPFLFALFSRNILTFGFAAAAEGNVVVRM